MSDNLPVTPVNVQQLLAERAQQMRSRLASASADQIRINTSGGFTLPDGTTGAALSVVIVDVGSRNMYYDKGYTRGTVTPPSCFAAGKCHPDELVPSESSPNKQNADCRTCPKNQFGSAATGKGKACKNQRVLALAMPDLTEDESKLYKLVVPPTSLKSLDTYISTLIARGMDPMQVVTEVTCNTDKGYSVLSFRPIDAIEDTPRLTALFNLVPIAEQLILTASGEE